MPIVQSELKRYKSITVSDTSSNGGRMSAVEIASSVAGNLFPAIGDAERLAGSTKYRKLFFKIANDADLVAANTEIRLDANTPAEDRMVFFPGTQLDTQNDLTGAERKYGGGALDQNASAGATTLDVVVEDGAVPVFVVSDKVRVSNKANIADLVGTEDYVTLSDVDTVADVVTLTFTPALANDYTTSNTRVCSIYEAGDVGTSVSNLVVGSAAGDYDVDFLAGDNIGTVEQTWTLTFGSATTFSIVGGTLGNVGSGSVGAGATPNNPDFTKPYFVMDPDGFSGSFLTGDTIVFQTHPAAVPIWVRRIVPAGAVAFDPNTARFAISVETSTA